MTEKRFIVFINHRTVDELDFVYRIRDKFVTRYGEHRVFMAPDSIPASEDSDKFLEEALNMTHVLVAIVGPKWEELLQEKSINSEEDWVRREIRLALDNDLIVAPVCIKRIHMPSDESVPCDIQPMLTPQFSFIRADTNFHRNVDKFIHDIEARLDERGIQLNGSNSFDHFMRLSLSDLHDHVFGLLKPGYRLDLDRLLRELPIYVLDRLTELDESKNELLKAMVSRIALIGTVIINYGDTELFESFLSSLRTILDETYRRFSTESCPSPKSRMIGYEFLRKLYLLGAILVQDGKYDWLPLFLDFRVAWDSGNHKRSLYTIFVFGRLFGMNLDKERLLASIVEEISRLTKRWLLLSDFF